MDRKTLAATLVISCAVHGTALAAAADKKEAQAAREKPLLRCDHLADKAQLDCLAKARERILEARKKREAAGDASKPAVTDEPKAPKKKVQ